MGWQYWIEKFSATDTDTIEEKLSELGIGDWEAITSWTAPGDPHINRGELQVYILFTKRK